MIFKCSARALALTAFIVLSGLAVSLHPTQADHVVTQEEYLQFQEGLA
jgi:hypothetical protein